MDYISSMDFEWDDAKSGGLILLMLHRCSLTPVGSYRLISITVMGIACPSHGQDRRAAVRCRLHHSSRSHSHYLCT